MIPARNGAAGGAMDANISHGETRKPTKEQVRAWLAGRLAQPMPLPSLEQIRQELGWATGERQMSSMSDPAEKAC